MKQTISLNGIWKLDWLSETPYTDTAEPRIQPRSESVTNCPVPGYWEDLADLFRTTALHTKLRYNPLYTLQRYPQTGYVPDMALPNPVGCFVYEKTVTCEEIPEGPCHLSVGGAQNTVSAWINGQYLGRHEGYCAPFGFEVPFGALQKGENRITLAVSNHRLAGYQGRPVSGLTSRAANECTGGIFGDVELRFLPDGLEDVWVSTAADCGTFTVHTIGAASFEKTVAIYDGAALLHTVQLPAGESDCTIAAEGFTLWSPASPKLYTAVVTTEHQKMTCRFGIRRLTVDGIKLLLNGKPFFFRGICEHCYQPLTVHPTRDKGYYRSVIRKLQELGFNSIRFHTWVPPVEYLEAADELGMVMEIESPNNTAYAEWPEIVRFCRHHAAVNLYSTGNELQIDADYEVHLQACAELVHRETDSLFSPMSAMRGIEYFFVDKEFVEKPFRHNPRRMAAVGAYTDLYNSYSNSLTSYSSSEGTYQVLDEWNAVYGKPLLSHEICIHGTYIDLSLEERYKGSRIGDTEFMSSVRKHLEERKLIDRSNLYYRTSSMWQRDLRKHCFETVRRCKTFAGYDFLGDIDTHWHTFGYCVGMMNEFYELKPGETAENVRRYNSETVLLADLPSCVNLTAGSTVELPILVSHFGETLPKALLQVRINGGGKVLMRKEIRCGEIPAGEITELLRLSFRVPKTEKPMKLTVTATLSGGDTDAENRWELFSFPKTAAPNARALREHNVKVLSACSGAELWKLLQSGKHVVLFGTEPFAHSEVSWQLSVAGRTNGHLATVIADHPLMEDFPHDGYCGRQFEHMLNSSRSVLLDLEDRPHNPIVDIASSYKNVRREAMLAEYRVGSGKLLICPLNLQDYDPGAQWLKSHILSYACSDAFAPAETLNAAQFAILCNAENMDPGRNENAALNQNDITS